MQATQVQTEEEYLEIDLFQVLRAVLRRWWLVAVSVVVVGAAALGWTYFMVTPTYESTALMYVNNSTIKLGASVSISSSELSAAKTLVDTYLVILNTRSTLNAVQEAAGTSYSYETFSKMIEADAVNNTEIFSVTITSTDPHEAEKLANTIASVLPGRIADVVDGSDVRIVDYAVVPAHRSAPSYAKNTAIGILLGLVLSVGYITLRTILDTVLRHEDQLTRSFPDIPILAAIPNMEDSKQKKSGYYDYETGGSNREGR